MSSAEAPSAGIYLRSLLAPLTPWMERSDVTDLYINRPGEVWVETLAGAIEQHEAGALTEATLTRLARQVAAFSHQGISREHPLLSAKLPSGERVQIVAPPARRGSIAIAIRKHVFANLGLADYASSGAFDDVVAHVGERRDEVDQRLAALLSAGDIVGTLSEAVRARRTILVSGGTSTGKTTFLNALLREVPSEERLILIEDTPELQVDHANMVGLLATRSALGESLVSANDLVAASLRMRPDRIILGELRGDEAAAFLRAVNSGHPGSMTTVHADSPAGAVEQIALLILQSSARLTRDDVSHYVRSVVGVYVQLGRTGGRRHVSEVALRP